MSSDRELNSRNFDIKFELKFDSDHLKSHVEVQIELKSAQKFKIQIQNLKFSKSMSLDRELNPWNFDIKFMPKFDSDHLESQIEAQIELKSAKKFKIQIWILKILKTYIIG